MDPLTAIGLVSNILSFIDFSVRLLKGAKEVHGSQHGVLEENRSRETIVREMQQMSARMLVSESPEKADDNSSLGVLARECHGLSVQLISLLEKIKPKDSGSTTQSLLSALRNKINDSERASLEARLGDCRAQLHLELSNLTRTETLEKLESLVQASKLDETKLDRIESHIAQLRENISLAPDTSETKQMLMRLLAEEEKVFTTIAQDRILNRLSFEGMNRRSNMVVETHSNTYEWILEDEPEVEEWPLGDKDHEIENKPNQPRRVEDIEKVRARDKLRTWLGSRSSRDVFHLSGKLGSGKSTLMKHIRASPRTEDKLRDWADGRKLTIANFYFWNIGSDYEKSLQGLYTSLLYQIFSQCPDFISKVWPGQWAQAKSAPWLVPKNIEVSERDVVQAFSRVIESYDMLQSHCFAFFIDGLDEFQSTVQDDHRDLVRLLCQWAASPSGNVKICVSSREYPVFMDGFTPTLRIRFHDLTRRDMDTYIRDKLEHASTEDSFEDLVSLIMSKANGVFLWVALVVKSLREGLENGMSCSELTREVDVLPEQLESLYKHILASLGKSARRKAYQTFSMVTELKKHGGYRMSLLAYSFFEEYEVGEKFFMKGKRAFPLDSLTEESGKIRAKSTSRKLSGWCKGLVEPYKTRAWNQGPKGQSSCIDAWEDWPMELDFAHRSVSDFLKSDDVLRDAQLNLRHFDQVDAVLHLVVSDVFYENATSVYNTSRSGITTVVVLNIMKHYNMILEPYTYLERVRELLAAGKPKEPMPAYTSLVLPIAVEVGFNYAHIAKTVGDDWEAAKTIDENSRDSTETAETEYHFISDPLQTLVFLGYYDYALWHINNAHRLSESPETVSELACTCLFQSFTSPWTTDHNPLVVLEALFERDWLSPNTITTCRQLEVWESFREESGSFRGRSLWHHFLISMLVDAYDYRRKVLSLEENTKREANYNSELCQLFLRYGADVEFSFSICVNAATTASSREFLLNLGSRGSVVKLRTLRPDEMRLDGDGWRRPWEESEIGLTSEDGAPARRHFTLREFLKFACVDKKDTVLQMLDERSKLSVDIRPNNLTTTTSIIGEMGDICEQEVAEDDGDRQRSADRRFKRKPTYKTESQYLGVDAVVWARCLLRNERVRYAVAVLIGVILSTLFSYLRARLGGPLWG